MSRDAALAKIHIARKELGLTEENYRAILNRVGGVDSASKLAPAAQIRVLGEFERLGWKPSFRGKRKLSSKPGVRLIFGLWKELGQKGLITNASRPALLAFVKRQTGVDDPEWLKPAEVNSVVEALKAMRARVPA